ncbi:MAG: ATP-binding protein [Mycobacteriaceae bacterium]
MLPSDLTAGSVARRHVARVCAGMPTEKLDLACLLVSELVSNAVLHGSGIVVLAVARHHQSLRVEVEDESPDMPVIIESLVLMDHGAGLRLVVALAANWGVASRDDGQPGKRVWFALL